MLYFRCPTVFVKPAAPFSDRGTKYRAMTAMGPRHVRSQIALRAPLATRTTQCAHQPRGRPLSLLLQGRRHTGTYCSHCSGPFGKGEVAFEGRESPPLALDVNGAIALRPCARILCGAHTCVDLRHDMFLRGHAPAVPRRPLPSAVET